MKTIITLSVSLLFAISTMANENRPIKGFDYAKHNKAKKRRHFMNRVFNLNNCKHYKQYK